MSELTLSVKVAGLEELRETVTLLKELKELGVENPYSMMEVQELPLKVSVEVEENEKPWYPLDGNTWIEHDGKSIPDGKWFKLLLKYERENCYYEETCHHAVNWYEEFKWNGCPSNNVVAYVKLED